MKRLLLIAFFCFFFSQYNFAQDHWGIGLRAGDPTGITAKKYMGNNALEISLGRTSYWYSGNRWYDNRIDYWYQDQQFDNYTEFKVDRYNASVPVSLQIHYLFHKDVREISNLQWYWGFGGQARMQRFYVDYRYKVPGSDWRYASDQFTNIDLGIDGVLGVEYNFDEVPISVFLDATLFMEIVDRPFIFWGQFGLGARYNFK